MNNYFREIQEKCKEEKARVEKMNYLSDYSSYNICIDKIIQFEDEMKHCFNEICEVKHIVQCTKERNKTHIEQLKFIKQTAEQKQEEISRQKAFMVHKDTNDIYIIKPSVFSQESLYGCPPLI